jgi:colanic acid/amylovoran biosynthesis glycosyltransferase
MKAFRVSYIIGTYPSLTTTFIDREIEELIEGGVDLAIVSIRRPRGDLSETQRTLQRRVSYLLPANPVGLALAYLRALLLQPVNSLRLLIYLVTRKHGQASRLRTVLHYLTGLYAAHKLANRRGVPLHAHFVDRAATVAFVASRLLGSRYSVTAHANDIYVNPVLLPEKVEQSAFVVTCTEYNRRHLESVLGKSLSAKVIRIYHGLDLAGFRPGPEADAGEDPWLLAVGQLKEKKGLRYLIDAVAALAARWPALQCEIVGEGPLRGDMERQIVELGLADRVRLAGALPHPEVVTRYARRPIFVLPCVVATDGDRDGIPNAILEAMAMELTVIATPISGIPEVVHDDETGILVTPADVPALAEAIGRALSDPPLRDRLGKAARRLVVDQFEQRASAQRLLAAMVGRD